MNNFHNNTQFHNLLLIPSNRYFPPPKKTLGYFGTEIRKNIVKKYYGNKIIFVQKRTQMTAAINRSKYFLHFKIDSLVIFCANFKSLANLIIFNTDIIFKYITIRHRWQYPQQYYPCIHPLQLKKALRSCKNPQPDSPLLKHLQHLFHLKTLTLHITNGSSMSKASKVIRKLRLLESFHVKYLSDYDIKDPNFPIKVRGECVIPDPNDKKGWGFFYKISKLPRLQRFSLQTSFRTLEGQSPVVQQDFADFYSKSHTFKIDTKVYVNASLDTKELTAINMTSILKTVDCLSLCIGVSKAASKKNPYTCQNPQGIELSEEENKKILKQGKRPVRCYVLYKEKLQVNIGCLLAKCENLVSLYMKISGIEVTWDQDYEGFPYKLQTMVFDVDFLGLKYENMDDRRHSSKYEIEEEVYEVANQRKVKFHSGLLELLKQLKNRAPRLEIFTLFMCLANFKKCWCQKKDFRELC